MIAAALLMVVVPVAADAKPKEFTAVQKRWWAFQPVAKPAVPAVKRADWVRNAVDAFVLAKLDEKGIAPSREASKAVLLRRLSLDLTGVPPSPEELQAFLSDTSANAYERQVERLLASPRYGERWARHWLDLARYADSNGFKADETRPHVWRYRDYVIRSFNNDKPYDRFVREQIAGDEMFPGDMDATVAVGFNRHFPDESNQANIMLRRQELLNDITDTVGATFLGMTVGCARCHDHKFDAIRHTDYYRLQAFFANTKLNDAVLQTPAEAAAWDAQNKKWEAATVAVRAGMEELLAPARKAFYEERLERFPEEIQEVITMDAAKRTPYQWQMFLKAKEQVEFTDAEVAGKLKGENAKKYKALQVELAKFDALKPAPKPVAQTMAEHEGAAPTTHVLNGGNYAAPLDEVKPGFLSILDPSDAPATEKRRSQLAEWLTRKDNPLTARVMANRIWHHHFGRGIAGTPSDFGVMGERPTNKELLDYLATRFVESNWSIKEMHRLIVTSATYRQDSALREDAVKIDPEDKLLWRYPRHRLEGEAVRDSMLAVSGALNGKMYGPGVFPPLPAGLQTRGGWKANEDPDEANRRSVYIFVRRNTRYPMLEAFDMPDTHESCGRRARITSVSQTLELLNSDVVMGWSKAFASRVANDAGLTEDAQIDRAFKLAYAREASAAEKKMSREFLSRQTSITGDRGQALTDFCHMLMNSNEFLYLN